jgi:hypothetical protein
MLIAAAAAYSLIAIVGFILLSQMVDESVRGPLAYALPLTLLSSVVTAPAAAYVAYVKAVGEQRLTIRPRVITLVANFLAIAVGVVMLLMWGIDPIIAPVVVTSIVLLLSWRQTFLRASRRPRSGDVTLDASIGTDGQVIDTPGTPESRRPTDDSALRDPLT